MKMFYGMFLNTNIRFAPPLNMKMEHLQNLSTIQIKKNLCTKKDLYTQYKLCTRKKSCTQHTLHSKQCKTSICRTKRNQIQIPMQYHAIQLIHNVQHNIALSAPNCPTISSRGEVALCAKRRECVRNSTLPHWQCRDGTTR